MDIQLNCVSPWDPKKPYKEQQQFLELDRRYINGKKRRNDWIGGRGSGKTLTAVLLAFLAAVRWCKGLPGMVTEPSVRKIRDLFLPLWIDTVPSELYTYSKSETKIMMVNGSVIYLRSRHVDSPENAMLKGMNVAWDIDDEMAEKCLLRQYDDIDMAVRVKSPYMFHDTLSTPIANEYQDLVLREDHVRLHTSSYCNPHLPEGWVDDAANSLSERYKAREIDGLFLPLSGLLWPEWVGELPQSGKAAKPEHIWPRGNIHPHVHDHSQPFYLAFDLGVATSAWLILQPIGDVWVVTAEYMPMREGSIEKVAMQIKQDYGSPACVVVGADINTRASTDGETGRYIVRRVFGSGIPVRYPTGRSADKEIQSMQLSYGIRSPKGHRAFCVSRELRSVPPRKEHNRGIMEVMTQDAWPENVKASNAWQSVKEHRLEHARDAAMYFAVELAWPPRYSLLDRVA